jgi:hypothetical protein
LVVEVENEAAVARVAGAPAAEKTAASAATVAMEVATVAGANTRWAGRGPRAAAGKEAPTAAVATAVEVSRAAVAMQEAEEQSAAAAAAAGRVLVASSGS